MSEVAMSKGTTIQVFGEKFAGLMDMDVEWWYKIHQDFANKPFKIKEVSPFTVSGVSNEDFSLSVNFEVASTSVKVDVQKNFGDICKESHCDYIVVDNSSALMELIEVNGCLYTAKLFEEHKTKINVISEGLSERLLSRYNLFINDILETYESKRIILIRSHIPRFVFDGGKIVKSNNSGAEAEFLYQLDDYFIRKTACIVLSTAMMYLDTDTISLKEALEHDVLVAISASPASVSMKPSKSQLISNYIAEGGSNLDFISTYFRNESYTFDDVAGLLWLYSQSDEKELFLPIAESILLNENNIVHSTCTNLFNRNLKALQSYDYCKVDIDERIKSKVVIRLNSFNFCEVSIGGFTFFTTSSSRWDHHEFINNNYACTLNDINNALESWETYFERGRQMCISPFVLQFNDIDEFTNSLYFMDYEQVLDNENYIITLKKQKITVPSYKPRTDLAFLFSENTRLCKISGGLSDQMNYMTFYETLHHEYNIDVYYYDLHYDVSFGFAGVDSTLLTSREIKSKRLSALVSKKLRRRFKDVSSLMKRGVLINNECKTFHALGLVEVYVIVSRGRGIVDISEVHVPTLLCYDIESFKNCILNKMLMHTAICLSSKPIIKFPLHLKSLYEKCYQFPDIYEGDGLNSHAFQICQQTYAIAIHIRRGDQLLKKNSGMKSDVAYKKALELVYTQNPFAEYPNKHLFVFSDDMGWVKNNREELGLHLAKNEITFVDWNHHFNSFRDMHLMSLCKVVIKSIGGFALTAGIMSRTVDYIIDANDKKVETIFSRSSYDTNRDSNAVKQITTYNARIDASKLIRDLNCQLEESTRKNESLELYVEKLKLRVSRYKRKYKSVLSSNSWKVTAPLRRLNELVKRR